MTINSLDLKKWAVRLLFVFPLLASIYCVPKILRSSQDSLSKVSQTIWFSLAILISETAFETLVIAQVKKNVCLYWFPQLFVTDLEVQESRGQGSGVYLLLQICHILAFIMVSGYHIFSYSFLLNYCPNHVFFANIPIIFLIMTVLTYIRHSDFVHIIKRMHELFTGFVMIYICGMAGNYFGCCSGIVILFGFFSARKPTWSVELDQVFWFFVGIYFNIIILSLTVYEMIERPVVLHNLNLFSSYQLDDNVAMMEHLIDSKYVAQIIDEYYAKDQSAQD